MTDLIVAKEEMNQPADPTRLGEITRTNIGSNKGGLDTASYFDADMQKIVPTITDALEVVPGDFIMQWTVSNFFRVAGGSEKINSISVADLDTPDPVEKPGFDIWFSGEEITVTDEDTGDPLIIADDEIIKKQQIIRVFSGSQLPAGTASSMGAGGFSASIKNEDATRNLYCFAVANSTWDIFVGQFNVRIGRDG